MATITPDYASVSGWNALLPPRQVSPSLQKDLNVDVVIVGAGFTGIACARRWQEHSPESAIALLDASEVGEGNPGRNSGFLLDIALAEDADPTNSERMAQCNQLTRESMRAMLGDLKTSGQNVDIQRAGTYRAAVGTAGCRSLKNYTKFLDTSGLEYRVLDRQQLHAEIGTEFYSAGLYSPDCYLAQPAAVIRALCCLLPESVELYENSPVQKISTRSARWIVETPGGKVSAHKLVLANNAFAKELGIAKPNLASVYTYAGLTAPLRDSQIKVLGENSNWGLLPMHRLGSTLRRTSDNRILVRSLHDYENERNTGNVVCELKKRLHSRFPQLDSIDFQSVWGGAVGFTLNGAPIWGELQANLYVAAGCNGGGTVKGTLFGQLLADLAHEKPVPDVEKLFGKPAYMPPDPFRGLGYQISTAWQSWRGKQEL